MEQAERETLAMRAAFDQAREVNTDVVVFCADYRDKLIRAGFSRMEAVMLVRDWSRLYWTRVMQAGGSHGE